MRSSSTSRGAPSSFGDAKGLRVRAALDTDVLPTGVKVEGAMLAALCLVPDKFHGDWNYTIAPQDSDRINKQPRRLRAKLHK